jgi:nitroimidazol reductase NimA-like FMN-containing flavoprotein (pyridoxamine 5'-phosphate oxidase superfamily)
MPGYGIAEAKGGQGLLPWHWAEEQLQKGRTYFIATSDAKGKPHLMPVWGVWFNNAFFFSTGNQSRKARNLSLNGRCSVGTEIDFERRPKKGRIIKDAVVLEGMAELVNDSRTRRKFSAIYQDKYSWNMEGFSEPIYRVRPRVVFGLTSKFNESATRWRFDG